jgi:hypothetical protein
MSEVGRAVCTKLNIFEAYDPVTDTWTTKAPTPTSRFQATAGVVNGVLYRVGGSDGVNDLATVEAYNPITNGWTTEVSMSFARRIPGVAVVNGTLYAAGGIVSPTTLLASLEAKARSAVILQRGLKRRRL